MAELLEEGWLVFRIAHIMPGTPEEQVNDLRTAFMAGAHHLWMLIKESNVDVTHAQDT